MNALSYAQKIKKNPHKTPFEAHHQLFNVAVEVSSSTLSHKLVNTQAKHEKIIRVLNGDTVKSKNDAKMKKTEYYVVMKMEQAHITECNKRYTRQLQMRMEKQT